MKIVKRSQNGKMLKIGEDLENSTWYFMTPKVMEFVNKKNGEEFVNFNVGDEVTIKDEDKNGSKTITFIEKGKGGAHEGPKAASSSSAPKGTVIKTGSEAPYEKKYYGKSIEERMDIKRQAIGNMVSRSLIGLQGHVDLKNIEETIEKLYKKYTEMVG